MDHDHKLPRSRWVLAPVLALTVWFYFPGCSKDSFVPQSVGLVQPATLAFTAQPTAVGALNILTPPVTVTLRTPLGQTLVESGVAVTIALGANPGNATLGGTHTVAAVNGVATFLDLSVDHVGIGYTLTATVPNVPVVTSNPFDVTGKSGGLSAVTGSPFALGPGNFAQALAVDPSGQILFAGGGFPLGFVTAPTVSAGGTLSANPTPVSFPSSVNALGVDPNGAFLLAGEQGNTVSQFPIQAGGTLGTRVDFSLTAPIAKVRIDPKRRFAFVLDRNQNITVFTIATNGTLSALPGPTATPGSSTPDIQVDPTGTFLIAGSQNGSNPSLASVFRIGSSGTLTPVTGSPFPVAVGMQAVVIDPTGRFVYFLATSPNVVDGYSLQSTGALVPVPGTPFAVTGGVIAEAVDPSGALLYVATQGPDQVLGFAINPSNGSLTALANSPFTTGLSTVQDVAVDPLDRFVYVANNGSPTVAVFNIAP